MPKKKPKDDDSDKGKGKRKKAEEQKKPPVNTHNSEPDPITQVPPGRTLGTIPSDTPLTGRTRADVDIFLNKRISADKLDDRYPTDCLVNILEDQDGWFKVSPVNIQRSRSGYVPHAGLIFPEPKRAPVFPLISEAASVPPATKLTAFLEWLSLGGKPAWIEETRWCMPNETDQASLQDLVLASIHANQQRWDAWVAEVSANQRLDEAEMNEWIVTVNGGREVFAIRDHYVYREPVQNGNYFGCAIKGQVMRWNGSVRFSEESGKRVNFYQVEFYRMSLFMQGWFRADLTGEYIYPTADNDPLVTANAKNVFDLSKDMIRHPQDPEISPTKKKGLDGAQYIDVFRATNRHLVHWCLCGEFCVAALCGSDIIPMLQKWIESKYAGINAILNDSHMGTTLTDLKSIMALFDLKSERYTSIPTSPQRIKERLDAGQFVLAGCGINQAGVVLADGKIRHWVVILDLLPVGNSGWVRVYNPFFNQEEVYEYNLFIRSSGVGAGLWIFPNQPA